ncbi:MAG: c-type cytochrome [Campylobacterales bacterium]|nr:c-type cytochrome [Campylobacterales bacterium]
MKIFLSLAMVGFTLFASDGYSVYKKQCMQCHVEMMEKQEVLKKFKTLKAPPMVEVSNRLKENIMIKEEDDAVKRRVIIAFIKDYIENPNIDYSMCRLGALDRFGVMPSLKGKLTEEERQAVAEWVHDRYSGVTFK